MLKNKLKNNKKGSLAFSWIYGISFLVALSLLYIIFNQVVTVDFKPVIEAQIADDSPERDHILAMNEEFLSYWQVIPIFLFFTVLLYMFNSGISGGKINP